MRLSFPRLGKILFAVLALACALPSTAHAYWHSGVYFGIGAPGYWAPPPAVVYAAPPPVVYAQPAPVVQAPPNQVSMQCASGPTVTVTGYKSTNRLLRQAASLCARRDASAPPPQSTIAWNDENGVTPPQNCREYQSKISVGGQLQQAYGTACQQPDGSWQPVK